MNRRFIQLSALAVAIALASSSCKRLSNEEKPEQKAASHIERAEAYRLQGQYRAAIIEARNAIETAPNDTRGVVELASLLNELNQGKQALQILEPIANSTDRAVVIARADALLAQGKFRSALEYLQTYRSEDADIRLRLAQAQAGLGQIADAEANLTTLENSALAITAELQLARLYLQQNNSDAAEEILKRILQKKPDHVDALALSAKLSEMRGDLETAETLLSRALINLPQTDVITPRKARVLQQLMPILTKLGRSSESLVYAKALADADPQGALLQDKFKQGLDAFKSGDLDTAQSLLDEVYRQSHNDYAGILLGMIKYSKKDYSGAAAYLGENVDPEITPDAVLKTLANAEMRLGQSDKLLALIDVDEREHIKDPELKALIGIALVQAGDTSGGEKMLTDALHSNPANAAVRATLARHYLNSQQSAKAIALLEESPAQQTDSSSQRLLIGAYVAAGKTETALQIARKLAATKPEQAVNYYVLGHTALIAQQYRDSENALQKVLTLQPEHGAALLDLAHLRLILQQPQPAADLYQRLIAANADNATALKGFITAQEMLGVKAGSNDIENRVLKVATSDTARAVVAEYYLRNQRRDDANRLLSPLNIAPGNTYAVYVKQLFAQVEGNELLNAKEFNRASQTVLEGLQLNTRNTRLLALLTQIQIAAGAHKEASKIIEQLAQVDPRAPQLIDLRTSLALATGGAASATQELRKLWSDAKTDQNANKLYQMLVKTDPAAAAQFLGEWQSALPNSDSPLLLRAVQYERDGNLEQAQKFYEAALSRNGNNPLTLNNLAMLYFSKKDNRALPLAEKAYALRPNNPAIVDTYGWLLVQSHQTEKGLEKLREALAIAPNATEIRQHIQATENMLNGSKPTK